LGLLSQHYCRRTLGTTAVATMAINTRSTSTEAQSNSNSGQAGTSRPDGIKMIDVVKSENDKRLYRGLVLENGLKALLISDSETDKSAAALDVNVGYYSDPWTLPGLAHFCEHMLFMGTERFPDENEYSKYLSQNSGGSNAYTSGEHTCFYFDVSPKGLEGALDRFAEFFRAPLFAESSTEREMKAVNSEHEKNIPNDGWRIRQLEHFLSNPQHDYHKFGTGNTETLKDKPKKEGIDVRQELLKFHAGKRSSPKQEQGLTLSLDWYSSNIMGMAILGKESLDELEEMVKKRFSNVDNKSVQTPAWENHPFRQEDKQIIVYAVPIKDTRR